jgi:hypothetical protein
MPQIIRSTRTLVLIALVFGINGLSSRLTRAQEDFGPGTCNPPR